MVTRSGPTLRMVIATMLSSALATLVAPVAPVAPVALGASDALPCRVRNVTQDAFGRSLIRMVERAVDGDRLRVRGTCEGQVVIRTDIVIRGVGDRPTVTGRHRHRAMRITRGARVTLHDLMIVRGNTVETASDTDPCECRSAGGAGILNRGALRAVRSVVRAGHAVAGGGIRNRGRLTLIDSAIRGNWGSLGAGLLNDGPRSRATLIRTAVARNVASFFDSYGGGIANRGTLSLIDSAVRRNFASYEGGGIHNLGRAELSDSSVIANRAILGGGGIWNAGHGTLTITGSSVTDNEVEQGDGGGIRNADSGSVTLDAESSVTDNVPDDCVGTPAC